MAIPSSVRIGAGGVELQGDLSVPPEARRLVIFAHGSGSSRRSPRNRQVAEALTREGSATLLFDLLTPAEEVAEAQPRHLRFDIDLLAGRLADTVDWVGRAEGVGGLPIGLFGASTGAAAALLTAARRPEVVAAVVSRGGRPDLAGSGLPRVRAPTLLIVGGLDHTVIELNRTALRTLGAPSALEIIPGATHLFEEAGALEQVAGLASEWFVEHA